MTWGATTCPRPRPGDDTPPGRTTKKREIRIRRTIREASPVWVSHCTVCVCERWVNEDGVLALRGRTGRTVHPPPGHTLRVLAVPCSASPPGTGCPAGIKWRGGPRIPKYVQECPREGRGRTGAFQRAHAIARPRAVMGNAGRGGVPAGVPAAASSWSGEQFRKRAVSE